MRKFALPRRRGKTLRLLYASEFNRVPILCVNERAVQYKKTLAAQCGLEIPEPITANDIKSGRARPDRILIDDIELVMQSMLDAQIIGYTISTDD